MTKPYRIIQIQRNFEIQLKNLDIAFTSRDVMSNGFWGTEFQIEKPKGKGATIKARLIDKL